MSFMTRTGLSIAIVAMTDNSTNSDLPTFDWDTSTKGTVLSSFFWGFIISSTLAGIATQKYGMRWVMFASSFTNSIATLLIPIGAEKGGWPATCALRIVQGLFTGIILAMAIGGALAKSSGGWPSIFYVFGSLSLAWCFLWIAFVYNTPAEHPYISEKEKNLIESHYEDTNKNSLRIPWLKILTSSPVWAMALANVAHAWGFYVLLSEVPAFFKYVFKYDIDQNGLLAACPYIAMLLFLFIDGYVYDLLHRSKLLPKYWRRRIFTAVGFLFPAFAMIGVTLIDRDAKEVAIVLLIIGAAGNAAVNVGYEINHVDISPNFAPVMVGLTISVGSISSALMPIVVGAVITDQTNSDQWDIIFWATGAAYILGTVEYFILGSEKVQSWNAPVVDQAEKKIVV